MIFFKFHHSIETIKLKNLAKRYILQWFQVVIDFLMHNAG